MGASERRSAPREEGESESAGETEPVVPPDTSTWWDVSRKVVNEAAYVRLRSELTAAIPEFELLVERSAAEGESWVVRGRDLLRMAVDALEEGALDAAWRHLHTAKRLEIYGLERLERRTRGSDPDGDRRADGEAVIGAAPDDERDDQRSALQVRAAVVYEESLEKLDGWRRRAVVDLLGDGDGDRKDQVTGPELRAASRILHEHYEGMYLVRGEQQRQFNHLVLMGVLSGLALFALSLIDWLLGDPVAGLPYLLATFLETPFGQRPPNVRAPGFAVFVTVAGVMGASLFGMRSLRKHSPSTDIPQQINRLTVTGARGVIGAISALLFYFALQAPYLWNGPALMESRSIGAAMVVVGFAAGYNERMAPAVVAKVASITETGSAAEDLADLEDLADSGDLPDELGPESGTDDDETNAPA